jgi:hypothetical protein
MDQQVRGMLQGTAGGRAEEWRLAEPTGEDQPGATAVPQGDYPTGAPAGVGNAQSEQFSRFGRYIGSSALPGSRDRLRRSAEVLLAPDDVLAELDRLPTDATYRTVAEIWEALGYRV